MAPCKLHEHIRLILAGVEKWIMDRLGCGCPDLLMEVVGNKERSEARQELLRLGNGAIHGPITQLCTTQREEGEEGLQHWWDMRGWGWVAEWGGRVKMVDVASTNQELQPAWRPRKKLPQRRCLWTQNDPSPKAGPQLSGSIQRYKGLRLSLFQGAKKRIFPLSAFVSVLSADSVQIILTEQLTYLNCFPLSQ